jgi:hypothetical protein
VGAVVFWRQPPMEKAQITARKAAKNRFMIHFLRGFVF